MRWGPFCKVVDKKLLLGIRIGTSLINELIRSSSSSCSLVWHWIVIEINQVWILLKLIKVSNQAWYNLRGERERLRVVGFHSLYQSLPSFSSISPLLIQALSSPLLSCLWGCERVETIFPQGEEISRSPRHFWNTKTQISNSRSLESGRLGDGFLNSPMAMVKASRCRFSDDTTAGQISELNSFSCSILFWFVL